MQLRPVSVTALVLPLLLSACSGEDLGTGPSLTPGLEPPPPNTAGTGNAGSPGDGTGAGGEGPDTNIPLEPGTAPASANPALTGVEVPGADCPASTMTMPAFTELEETATLPDPFTFLNGAAVTTQAQ